MRSHLLTAILVAVLSVPAHAANPLQILTDTLSAASVNVAYNQPLTVTGGDCQATGTPSSSIDSGTLPGGLFVTSPSGVKSWSIQGVPNASGTFQFVLHLRWTHQATSPFDHNCTDEAVKTLTLTVQGAQLTVDRTQVSATYRVATFPPAAQTVRVTSGGGTPSPFTVQVATNSGGNWLSATPLSGSTPASLSIGFAPSGLQPGVYTGTVTLASGAATPTTISVSLTVVVDSTLVLRAAPTQMTFTSPVGGPAPSGQTLSVTVTGESVIFQADVNVPLGGKWLAVTPSGSATPAQLTVQVDPKGLSPGTYQGTITLHLAFVTTVAQTIPVTYTVQAAPVLPAITANGVVNAANLTAAIAPGTWVSIFGANLSATTRPWRDTDFVGGRLPTSIDGVTVTINGKPAPVAYVSPGQINVLAPDETATGLVFAQVRNAAGVSENALVLEQTAAPALFQFRAPSATYVAGTHADGSYLAGVALVQQGIAGTPAKPGETIVVYGTGFGATQPSISATAVPAAALPLANPQGLRIRIGGVDAAIAFAGLISPGVYQFNLVVPEVPDGDQTLVAELRGLLTRADLLVSVQH
jgi:uncharacterized protein (TIGR03437 family)